MRLHIKALGLENIHHHVKSSALQHDGTQYCFLQFAGLWRHLAIGHGIELWRCFPLVSPVPVYVSLVHLLAFQIFFNHISITRMVWRTNIARLPEAICIL